MPSQWNELWQMLPERRRVGSGWQPPPPLILAAWHEATPSEKRQRLHAHIRYADSHGVLTEVDAFLRGLSEAQWAHLSEL